MKSYVTTYTIDGVICVSERDTREKANELRTRLGMNRKATDVKTIVYVVNNGTYKEIERY